MTWYNQNDVFLLKIRKSPGLLYSHNDSGGNATVHVLNSSGGYLGKEAWNLCRVKNEQII